MRRTFDYLGPTDANLPIGTLVRVPLHGRRVRGWVLGEGDPPADVTLQSLTVSGGGPPASVVALCEWAAWRFAGTVQHFLGTASPQRRSPLRAAPLALPENPDVPPVTVIRLAPATDPKPVVADVAAKYGATLVLAPARRDVDDLEADLGATSDWASAAAGHSLVVGARAGAFAPMPQPNAIVVLDAHDPAYRSSATPTWNAVDVVIERARRAGIPCVLVSAVPTLELVARARVVTTARPVEREGWARIEVVDRRATDPRRGLLSDEVVNLCRRQGQIICICNRTGRIRLLGCADCHELVTCEHCHRPLDAPGSARLSEPGGSHLDCRHCGTSRPGLCTKCGSSRLKVLRAGVTRLAEELAAILHEEVADLSASAPEVGSARVIVGTEAALHRVRRAAAVCFLDFDQHLAAPRFRAGEEAMALLALASRVVDGRRGTVMVQTWMPEHGVIAAAAAADPSVFDETPLRRELGLPPFAALALVSGAGAADALKGVAIEVQALGEDRFLCKGADHDELCAALATISAQRDVKVEIDPLI